MPLAFLASLCETDSPDTGEVARSARRGAVAPQGRMRGEFASATRSWAITASLLISRRAGPPTASPSGEANIAKNRCFFFPRSSGFMLAYTRPTYLLYHFYYVLFNPDYAQILHIKVVRSANRRNLRAVV